MGVDVVARLLDEHKWELCAALADDMLSGDLTIADRALVSFARARSLSNLDKYSLALEPAQAAVVLADQSKQNDLLGRSLLELAYIQGHIIGHETEAIQTLRRFLNCEARFAQELRERTTEVLFNLAVYERASLHHEEALEHFRLAWERTNASSDAARREMFRQDYCWQALNTGNLDLAAKLIALGEHYLKLHQGEKAPAAHVLADKARYNLLRGDPVQAAALAMKGLAVAEELGDAGLMAWCLVTWSSACEGAGDPEAALSTALWAFQEAQRSQRPELIAEVGRRLRALRMEHPAAVDTLMTQMVRKA